MIGVVDYGLGNVKAILNIYKRLGIEATAAGTPEQIAAAKRLILPGVGAFDWAMGALQSSGFVSELKEAVEQRRVPVLGICVGMQMLATSSEEGALPGLNWIPGMVRSLSLLGEDLLLPHMGWNSAKPCSSDGLFSDLGSEVDFYFLHSFYFEPVNERDVLASTTYGQSFASAVRREHVFGVQYHPEKSHQAGVQLLRNFAEQPLC